MGVPCVVSSPTFVDKRRRDRSLPALERGDLTSPRELGRRLDGERFDGRLESPTSWPWRADLLSHESAWVVIKVFPTLTARIGRVASRHAKNPQD